MCALCFLLFGVWKVSKGRGRVEGRKEGGKVEGVNMTRHSYRRQRLFLVSDGGFVVVCGLRCAFSRWLLLLETDVTDEGQVSG